MDETKPILALGIGEVKVAKHPAIIRTNLGSCIAVCLYEANSKVGGMLHLMLPSSQEYKDKPGFRKAKYADTGIVELLEQLNKSYGFENKSLKAKIFGGAKLIKGVSSTIGQDNEAAVGRILKEMRIPIIASKTGGERGYQVDFDLENGSVSCRVFGEQTEVF